VLCFSSLCKCMCSALNTRRNLRVILYKLAPNSARLHDPPLRSTAQLSPDDTTPTTSSNQPLQKYVFPTNISLSFAYYNNLRNLR
jgi:hypothetical protein